MTHQSGFEVREYGTLGEVARETLTLTAAANGGSTPPVYTTRYDFDSFGRMLDITMPDNEVITNQYDSGGNVNHIAGTLNGRPYAYMERLDYDRFEQRLFLKVGNGVETSYTYDPRNRRLSHLMAGSPGAKPMQDIAYSYDNVGNITELNDTAPIPKANEYGGLSLQHFAYDDLYRLVKADGAYTTAREVQNYQLAMQYDEIHNIVHKNQLHTVTKNGGTPRTELATTYDWGYTYQDRGQMQPHAPTHIGNRSFDYDANGNQAGWQNDDNGTRRVIVWDEDNRIREVQDPKHGAAFTYDDKGDRKLRKSQYGETAYINQFFSVRNGAIASTHVYAGTARIVTKVGAGTPVGKVKNNLKGTGNLNPNDPIGGSIVVGDTATPGGMKRVVSGKAASTTASGSTTTAASGSTSTTTPSPLAGEGRGEGKAFPGQGLEHRSDRANEVAQNTEKNKHLNGSDPGGVQGADNSNAGGNGNAAGSSNNAGNNGANTGGGGNTTTGTGSTGLGGGTNSGGTGNTNTNGGAGQGNGREFIYFYHPDHLGSTGYVTDEKALRYEHITYFPFGETWVQESTASWRVPYQFTSKEMDPETGLYYFGARYYDPRTSVWQSADQVLGIYLPTGNKDKDAGLPGMGGVYSAFNLAMYTYVHLNPMRLADPDGNWPQAERERMIAEGRSRVAGEQAMIVENRNMQILSGVSPDLNSSYIFGAKMNHLGDCSNAMRRLAPELPDGSSMQRAKSTKVEANDILPGDLIFFKADPKRKSDVDHVGMVSGNIKRDENGNVLSFDILQSSGGKGWNETTVTIGGKNKLDRTIVGFGTYHPETDPPRQSSSFIDKAAYWLKQHFGDDK